MLNGQVTGTVKAPCRCSWAKNITRPFLTDLETADSFAQFLKMS